MQEAEDEPLFCERAAGVDIGKQLVSVTILVPSESRKGGRQQETREFGTTRRELLALADWLRCWGVTRAGMESTSDYWKPVFFLLEREGFDCLLYPSSQVKALPGRPKTDLLTELQCIAAAQEAERLRQQATTLSRMSQSAGANHRNLSMGATETGHTALNRSLASPRCCFSVTSHHRTSRLIRPL